MRYCLFLLVWLAGGPLQGATLEVCADCTFSSLQAAVQTARPGDTIYLMAGVYREANIRIDKPLRITGRDMPVIDGGLTEEILTIEADSVLVEGIEFRNAGKSHIKDLAAIRIKRHDHFIIRNNRIINALFGIYIENGKYGLIENNTLLGEAVNEMSSGNAIHMWYCKNVLVEHNYLRGHRDGIYLEFVDSSRIRLNISEDNIRYGLHFMFSNDDDYFHNTFRRNGAGVAVMFSRRINMWENTFEHNWGRASYGLLLKEIYDAEIRDNTFRENTIGIYVEGSTRLQYRNNEFSRNGWAIKMSGGCLDNVVANNNFRYNTFDLALNSAANNNRFDGNYWSNYTGYDLGRDGRGDVPYHPVKLFNYVVNRTPEAMVLLRSLFVGLLNFSEKVSPVFTPANVADNSPLMRPITFNRTVQPKNRN
ncbi:MAG: nitrous oxide reductase family maturation protein NosD [Lewinella sp.]|nr:nitrous oxide reductase family maturation protein NosD [Lewinella sp.]